MVVHGGVVQVWVPGALQVCGNGPLQVCVLVGQVSAVPMQTSGRMLPQPGLTQLGAPLQAAAVPLQAAA